MKCELIRSLMSSYIDRDINEIDRISLEKHLQQCSECREEYELLLEVINQCNDIEEAELPDSFHEELHQKLLQEQQKTKVTPKIVKFINNYRWKAASGLVAAVLIIAIAINGAPLLKNSLEQPQAEYKNNGGADTEYGRFAAGNTSNYDVSAPMASAPQEKEKEGGREVDITYSEAAPVVTSVEFNSSNALIADSALTKEAPATEENTSITAMQAPSRATTARKVIKSGNLTIKVASLDAKVNEIKSITEGSGGYVENSQINNNSQDSIKYRDEETGKVMEQTTVKSASIVIRIPQEQFDGIFNTIKAMGKIENENIIGNDITLQYRDTEATVQNLRIKEQKLQELMTAKADTVEEILRIESELNNVRTSIDIMSGDLKKWDDLVQLSTIYINLTEVKETELIDEASGTIWDKAIIGFNDTIRRIGFTLERTFVLLIASVPLILMFSIPLAIMIFLLRRKRTVRN